MKRNQYVLCFVLLSLLVSGFSTSVMSSSQRRSSACSFQSSGDGIVTSWAILIGVGFNPHQYLYVRRDIRDLSHVLIRHGWKENNIQVLVEEQATREAILSSFEWLNQSGVDEDDIVFFYSGTHGYHLEDQPPFDEPDGLDEFIMPFDCDWETNDNCITDDELGQLFDQVHSENLAIFIESCYSGGMIDGECDLGKSGRVVVTASEEDELSCPLVLRFHWLFCFYCMMGMKGRADYNEDTWVSVEEIWRYAKPRVMIRSTIFNLFTLHSFYTQHPLIYDGWPSEEHNEEELGVINL
jgi:hypothetical protein